MIMDGLMLHALVRELNETLGGGRIDRVYMPDRDLILLHVRANGRNHRLLLTCSAQYARLHITQGDWPNPDVPPMLCMLLRKRLVGARILDFAQPGLERLCRIRLSATDDLGEPVALCLVVEVMGRHSNIMLLNGEDTIIDCLKHVGQDVSRVRQALPGLAYRLPPAQEKLDPLSLSAAQIAEVLRSAIQPLKLDKLLCARLAGVHPASAKALLLACGWQQLPFLSPAETAALSQALYERFQAIDAGVVSPTVCFEHNQPVAFFPFAPGGYEDARPLPTVSAALDLYYGDQEQRDRRSQRAQALLQTIRIKLDRCQSRLAIHTKALENPEQGEKYRLYGDLLTANLYALQRGQKSAIVVNYYDESAATLEIPLDPRLTPNQNAQRYYKRYAKSKAAVEYAKGEVQAIREEMEYLRSQLVAIVQCASGQELDEVRRELEEQGVVKKQRARKKAKAPKTTPFLYRSSDGYEIRVGKNNVQNDALTFKWALPRDIWLHAKEIPGSHVIIRAEGKEIPETTLREAAMLAAYHSAASQGQNVPVDYTQRRLVKKPSGAKPGMVIYFEQKTLYVTPDVQAIAALRA